MANNNNAGLWGYSIPLAAATISSTIPHIVVGAAQTVPPQVKQSLATTGAMNVDEKVFAAEMKAAEAKTDSKFAQFMGELRVIASKIDHLSTEITEVKSKVETVEGKVASTKAIIITTVIGSAIGIAGLAFAAVAIFQSGMGLTATAYQSGMTATEGRAPASK